MNSFIRKMYYIVRAFWINVSSAYVKVSLTSEITPSSVLTKYNKIGKHTYFNGVLKEYSYVGCNCDINAYIGRYCSIGTNVKIIGGIHPTNYISTSPVFYSVNNQCGKNFINQSKFHEGCPFSSGKTKYRVVIGNDVWIGDNVIIKSGVKIGDGAIIGMGAVVTKDVDNYAIIGGNPAKVIRYRFDERMCSIIHSSKWWDWNEEKLKNVIDHIDNPDKFVEIIERNSQ